MERKITIGRILFAVGFIIFLFFGTFAGINVKAAKIEKNSEKTIESDRMIMKLTYGYGKYVKFGRYMRIHANITNLDKDFTGKICVLVPDKSEESILYSKNISIAKGETKEIEFSIPVTFINGIVQFSVTDEKEEKVLEKEVRILVETDINMSFIGILSDDYSALNYLSTNKTRTILLDAETFARDAKALDMLDIIVINNFNTKKLNEQQYEVLKDFVQNGGSLVLGTGSTGNKTLQLFQDDFLTGTMKDLTKETIYFDEEKKVKVKKDVQNIILEDSKSLLQQNGKPYIQKKEAGLGSICLFQFDLSLEQDLWKTVGEKISELIQKSMSKTKQQQLKNDYQSNTGAYSASTSLSVTDSKSKPKVENYAIVLFIYLFIIGPPSYLIMKRLDKRNFIWIFVPTCAVVFTVIIYFMGSNTRLKEPIMSYMSIIKADGSSAQEEAYFQVMTPSNRPYEIDMSADYSVSAASLDSWYTSDDNLPDYSVEINYGSEQNRLIMKNVSAFKSSRFKATAPKKINGFVTSKINFDDFKYKGTITNESEYDLKDAVAILEGEIYKIGDFKAGETKKLEECKSYKYRTNNVYGMELASKLMGKEPYNTDDANYKRRFYTLEYYLAENIYRSENQVFGFIDKNKTLLEDIPTKKEGVQLLAFSLDVNYQKGKETIIPNITSYYELTEGSYDYNNIIYEPITFDVPFNKGDHITSLIYSKELNPEFDHTQAAGGFSGKVMAYNNDTNNFDVIFESGTEGELKNLKPYLNEENTMKLKFTPEQKQGNYTDTENYIPTLSVTKEEE